MPGELPAAAAGDAGLRAALARGGVIDITTTGRRSWLANLGADPRLTFHLKGLVTSDLPATARIVDEEAERHAILPHVARAWGRDDIEAMVRHSSLIEVTIDGIESGASGSADPGRGAG